MELCPSNVRKDCVMVKVDDECAIEIYYYTNLLQPTDDFYGSVGKREYLREFMYTPIFPLLLFKEVWILDGEEYVQLSEEFIALTKDEVIEIQEADVLRFVYDKNEDNQLALELFFGDESEYKLKFRGSKVNFGYRLPGAPSDYYNDPYFNLGYGGRWNRSGHTDEDADNL